MHILLQQPVIGQARPRYLHLSLQQDLLGGWELLRESGHSGSARVQLRRELFLEHEQARQAFEKVRDSHIKRGFVPVQASS